MMAKANTMVPYAPACLLVFLAGALPACMVPTAGDGTGSSASIGKGDGYDGEARRYVGLYLERVEGDECANCVAWLDGTISRPADRVHESGYRIGEGSWEGSLVWDPPNFLTRVALDELESGQSLGDPLSHLAFGEYDASDRPSLLAFGEFEWRSLDLRTMSYRASGSNVLRTKTMHFSVRAEQLQEVVITSYCDAAEQLLIMDPARSGPDDYQTVELLPGENRVAVYAGSAFATLQPDGPDWEKIVSFDTTTWNFDSCSWSLAVHRVSGLPSDAEIAVQGRYAALGSDDMLEGERSDAVTPVSSGSRFEAAWDESPLVLSGVYGSGGDLELTVLEAGTLWDDVLTTCALDGVQPSVEGPFTVECQGSAEPISVELEFLR